MTKSLNDILKRYSDALSGKRESKVSALTTGDNPGVDYADKMKDGRDFIAQHSVEKHEDRVGNGDDVYNASKVQKAKMERHGHEPKPKDIKVYKKNQQVGEETDSFNSGTRSPVKGSISLDEIKKPLANYIKKRKEELKDFGDEDSIRRYNKQGVTVGDQLGKDVKARSNKFIAKAKSKLGEAKDDREYGYEGDMAITQLKTICRNSEHLMKMLKPDTDLPEWVQSKITKAEDYISTAHDYLMSEMNEETEQLDELTGRKKKLFGKDPLVAVANRAIDRMKLPPNGTGKLSPEELASNKKNSKVSRWAFDRMGEEVEKLDEAKCNMTEAGKMCEVHGNKACPKEGEESASDKEPRYNGKKKEGRQLITDKKNIQEVLNKKTPVGEIIKDFQKSDDPRFEGDSKAKRKERALAAWYKMHPEKSNKVNEGLANHTATTKESASEKARRTIIDGIQKKKLQQEKMKEQSAPAETPITMPSGAVGDTGRV